MEFKGTKGEWEVIASVSDSSNSNNTGHYSISIENWWFSNASQYKNKTEAKANALLISKAPELLNDIIKDLKLLEMVAKEIEHSDKWLHSDVLQRIEEKKQLIKQATEL